MAPIASLFELVSTRSAVVGVVGLGHVGLATACAFASAGFRVIGVDRKPERVASVGAGRFPLSGSEPELPRLLADVVASLRLTSTTDARALAACDVILIDVETPVEADHAPRFEALSAACRDAGAVMKDGALVVVESTVAPGTTARVVAPLLAEASGKTLGHGFLLGHAPQRVMPGKLLENLRTLPRLCGADAEETRRLMTALYGHVVRAEVHACDAITAEIVKTAENTQRDVLIAFANELAVLCEAVGADFARVRELAFAAEGARMLHAGAGVGGHCIPKDPWLLLHGAALARRAETAPRPPSVVAAARAVNERMPAHVVDLLAGALAEAGRALAGARILVLGRAYLPESGDIRNSPSDALRNVLRDRGVDVVVHDPWLPELDGDLYERAAGAHGVVLMVAHEAYRELDLRKLARSLAAPVLVDGRRVVEPAAAAAAGLVFRAVGWGGVA